MVWIGVTMDALFETNRPKEDPSSISVLIHLHTSMVKRDRVERVLMPRVDNR